MATTLQNLIDIINDRRRDSSANSVDMTTDGFRAIVGAQQIWDSEHEWPWQITKTEINVRSGITTYRLASSLNFKAIVDIRPKKEFSKSNELEYLSNNRFDSDTIYTKKFAVKTEDQKQYLRVKYPGQTTILNQASGVTDNGTWVGATAISNLSTDPYESFNGQYSSLKFDYSGTTGTLTNSTMPATDVSRYAQRSGIYFDIDIKSITNLTSFTIKYGSSASNYITGTVTTDYLGNPFVVGYNRVCLEWNGITTVVGSPDSTAWTYIQVTEAYSSNPSTVGNHIENFFISENIPMIVEYYSHNTAYDTSLGVAVQSFNDATALTTDTALWSGDWDVMNETFVNSVMEIIFWMTGETDDRTVAITRIQAMLVPLKAKYPSKRRYAKMQLSADINL